MAEIVTTATAVETEAPGDAKDTGVVRRRLGVTFYLALVVLVVIIGGCILDDKLPFVKDFRLPDASRTGRSQAFSAQHWLGTDNLGRDNLARILKGGRTSLWIAFSVTILGFVGGGLIGLVAGYFKGWIERVLMGVVDIFLAFPALVLALAVISVLEGEEGASVNAIILALSVIAVPPLARITRATTLQFSQREFVTAARSMGAGHFRIIRKEILPNVLPPMFSFSLVVVAIVLVAEAGLGVIGLGLPPDKYPTWGNMISSGARGVPNALRDHASVALTPAAIVFLTVLSLNLIGDKLRQRFDVKESGV